MARCFLFLFVLALAVNNAAPAASTTTVRTTGHWMATGKAWGLASSLWEALRAWGAGGGPVEATAPTASTATY